MRKGKNKIVTDMPSVWSEVYMRFFFLDCSLSLKKKKKMDVRSAAGWDYPELKCYSSIRLDEHF